MLVVEDEPLVAMEMAHRRSPSSAARWSARLEEALHLATAEAGRGTPFIWAAGNSELEAALRHVVAAAGHRRAAG
ncbi:hypothetical protein JMJ56_18265 [Belnapia sp. T18]|uniref:Uncharacterized protein n=1 Tax=Belnapia arida TaxID=2804533 RepID=A0ABS1U5K3_9PROT|nr:hypothetical protein [Belnapia arida]MBL6079969.1 hypothetical protein [Belnapia arida]